VTRPRTLTLEERATREMARIQKAWDPRLYSAVHAALVRVMRKVQRETQREGRS
jgi:hypothetical protein